MLTPLAKDYILATRPKMSIFGLLIYIACAVYAGAQWQTPMFWLTALALVACICATVILNDYVDREHDRDKQRTLASNHPTLTKYVAATLWLITAALIIPLWPSTPQAALILGLMSVLGLTYSWMRAIPLLSGVTVSLSYALICPLAWQFTAQPWSVGTALATITIFCAVHGRETIADMEDLSIDIGYKATIPVLFGEHAARWLMTLTFGVGWISALALTFTFKPLMLVTLPLCIRLIKTIWRHPFDAELAYDLVDKQTLIFAAILILSPLFS